MSHLSQVECQIMQPNNSILKATFERLCKMYPGAEIVTEVKGDGREVWPVDIGITAKNFPRGIGIRFKNQEKVTVHSYYTEQIESFNNNFTSIYQLLGLEWAFGQVGMTTSAPELHGTEVHLLAVQA